VPRVLVALLAALAVFALGCQESGFDESKETSKPLKVQHALGESKVPGQAERPATLTRATLEDTLALGVRPVRAATPLGGAPPAYLIGQVRGVRFMRPLTAATLPSLEAADPDVILGSASRQARLYDDLIKIAPTVMVDGHGVQWKLDLRLVGEALGRTNDAEQLLIGYDADAARTRRAIRRATGSRGRPRVALVQVTRDGLLVAPHDSFAGTILADAGLKQVTRYRPGTDVDLLLVSEGPSAGALADGSFTRVEYAPWWGDGGLLAARAALAELRRAAARAPEHPSVSLGR
jgi:iron-siderophore transport system substrate-binding protein